MKPTYKISISFLLSFFIAVILPSQALANFCDPLPTNPSDTVVTVTPYQASQLPSIVYNAQPGTTILLEDGTYSNPQLNFNRPRVTLRSKSGNRENVILDGQYSIGEIIFIRAANVTIADLTIKRAYYHPIHVVSGGHYVMLYNLHIIDGKEQFIKVNPDGNDYADYGTLACSLMELTDTGRAYIQANPTPGYPCYTGGLDAHQTWGWTVRDNTIKNIYCTNGGLAEHAIHFWKTNRDSNVERNILINNARGIGFGLGSTGGERTYPDNPLAGSGLSAANVGHIGGTIKNNFVFANIPQCDTGIGLEQAWNVGVYHNTVYSASYADIDVRFANSNPELRNNLTSKAITLRDGAQPRVQQGNLTTASAGMFVNAATGDLHLVSGASAAINKGVSTTGVVTDDIDGDLRDAYPDIGADEYKNIDTSSPAAPTRLRIR